MPTTLSGQTYIGQAPYKNPIQRVQEWWNNISWNPVNTVQAFEPTNNPPEVPQIGPVVQAPIQSAVNPTETSKPIVRYVQTPQAPVDVKPNYGEVDKQTDEYAALIDQEYNNQINSLAGDEQSLQRQADASKASIGTEFQNVLTQLGQEQGTKEEGVQTALKTGETENKNAMQTARDLFRQTQQSNIAQLSALGISSSSVAEGLAERLGVETARRLNGLTGSIGEMRLQAVKEMANIKNYYEARKTTLATEKANREVEIQNSLLDGLRKINDARNSANTAKAQARIDLFYNAQSLKAQLQKQYEAFNQSLETWAAKKADAVIPLTTEEFYKNFQNQLGVLQSEFNPTQFSYNPSITTDQYGRMKSSFTVKPKTKDDLATPEVATTDPTDPSYWN